jgi:hypothetical protein
MIAAAIERGDIKKGTKLIEAKKWQHRLLWQIAGSIE